MQNSYIIKHDRQDCIGCNACANIAPKFWEMSDEDGKSNLIGANNENELEIQENAFQTNMDSAESCPVNVIHLIQITKTADGSVTKKDLI